MNLHAIVSGAIGSVNHHEMVTIYRCNGTTNTAGVVSVTYTPSDIMAQVQAQMGHLEQVDTKELGEVIDMIKDLSEAIYYCTITEAMEEKDKEKEVYYYPMDSSKGGRMYYKFIRKIKTS